MRNSSTNEILQDISSTSNKILSSSSPPLPSTTNENGSAFQSTNQKSMTSQSANNSTLSSAFQPINKSQNTISPSTKSSLPRKSTSFNADKDLSMSDILGMKGRGIFLLFTLQCLITEPLGLRFLASTNTLGFL